MSVRVKICGITREKDVDAAVANGANMLGFVFFPPSPRSVDIERAKSLVKRVPPHVQKIALSVDASNSFLSEIVRGVDIDMIQLHGGETPERCQEIQSLSGVPVMKALAIAVPKDVSRARLFEPYVDTLMFDAKAPVGATRPGGNALSFDWSLVFGKDWSKPWILAGGLTAENVGEAISKSGAVAVDVSSGVENRPGIKSVKKIQDFITAARS
ncbi:MAG: N-(5'-phosphoribosyl)anthranilate isomerase [Rhodospirillaceae bacterium TMED8]|nr:phosphoribosylanthranilate isomerase [Magnetovibrio sp.]OUT49915.1 MAG: N-(5'-phosphoribosyl)anthranilate isomerase [Rhodospirillaceae bacterium TMED8]|tara:strand:- start:154 stop:792 length:639 start_codon:yes stop_codon:yes gene_type:complete